MNWALLIRKRSYNLSKPDGSLFYALLKASVWWGQDENAGLARIAFSDMTQYRFLEREVTETASSVATASATPPPTPHGQ